MLPGDVALFRPHSLVGRLISLITSSRYCHVRMIVDEAGSTVEADFKGSIRGRVEEGDVVVSAPLTPEQREKILAVATALIGIPYAWSDVFALGFAQLGIRLPGIRHRIARRDRLFCSQLVDQVWQSVGYRAFHDGRLPQNVSPGDLADLAFVDGWATRTIEGTQS